MIVTSMAQGKSCHSAQNAASDLERRKLISAISRAKRFTACDIGQVCVVAKVRAVPEAPELTADVAVVSRVPMSFPRSPRHRLLLYLLHSAARRFVDQL